MTDKDKDRTPVAQFLLTYCTRCKLPLKHVVVAHNSDGIVARVLCRTCGSEHKYRPEKKKTPRKTARKGSSSAKVRKPPSETEFELLCKRLMEKDPVPYSMQGTYQMDDVILHKTFGKGFVTEILYQKMEVVFADAPRTLVCDRL